MFSWLTGPRIANVIEDIEPDPANDTTFIDPPDTPAPQFAVKAFKHALFGTPAAQERKPVSTTRIEQKNTTSDTANHTAKPELPAPKEDSAPISPSKRNGILMTPGTASRGRKTVSFGAHVVDNEGKRGGTLRSGIPNDCPGKFPSPWTPGTDLKKTTEDAKEGSDSSSSTRPRTKLTAALYNARSAERPTPRVVEPKPKAKDDSDITLDLSAPRSESGKYWKEQYESYAARSEKEMKKLVTKQQLARNYAKKKDDEAIEAVTRLGEERKRFRLKERQLEQQNRGLEEQLQQARVETEEAKVQIAALKERIAALEKRLAVSSSQGEDIKASFEIYEDSIKDSSLLYQEQDRRQKYLAAASGWRHTHSTTEDKENSPPKPLSERKTLHGAAANIPTAKSMKESEKPTLPAPTPSRAETSPLRVRRPQPSNSKMKNASMLRENLPLGSPPKSPTVHLPSSPLPQPSPDPWMDMHDSPAPAVDRMALPIASGGGFGGGGGYGQAGGSKRSTLAVRNRGCGSRAEVGNAIRRSEAQAKGNAAITSRLTGTDATASSQQRRRDSQIETVVAKSTAPAVERSFTATATATAPIKPEASTVDGTKAAAPAGDASYMTTAGNRSSLPVDRKEEARRRLAERKEKKRLLAESRLSVG